MASEGKPASFEGKVALVTGAARGIGKEIALTLARRGATVVIGDIDVDGAIKVAEELKGEGLLADAIGLDMGNVADIRAKVGEIYRRHGQIDILVNNAGICPTTPIEEIQEEEWDKVLDVNLKGVFFLCQAVMPKMKERRYGKIINISSVAGRMGALVAGCHYSASKAGILGITKVLARYLAPYGINVNAVAPGTTLTAMTEGWSEEEKELLRLKMPIGRLGTPKDIASVVAFLASDESGFIVGATVDVNGGMFMV